MSFCPIPQGPFPTTVPIQEAIEGPHLCQAYGAFCRRSYAVEIGSAWLQN